MLAPGGLRRGCRLKIQQKVGIIGRFFVANVVSPFYGLIFRSLKEKLPPFSLSSPFELVAAARYSGTVENA